jgi:hypothetical protein
MSGPWLSGIMLFVCSMILSEKSAAFAALTFGSGSALGERSASRIAERGKHGAHDAGRV